MSLKDLRTAQEKSQINSPNNPTLQEYRAGKTANNEAGKHVDTSSFQTTTSYETHVDVPGVSWNSKTVETSAHDSIDIAKAEQYLRQLQSQQNPIFGFLGGLTAAVIAAIIWAFITVTTDFQIGWMAVGVGLLVGFAIRIFGKGIDKGYGYMGSALSLLGCLLGNFLAIIMAISRQESLPFQEAISSFVSTPIAIVNAMKITFNPISLIFYGIAVYEGYHFSFRRLSMSEVASLRK